MATLSACAVESAVYSLILKASYHICDDIRRGVSQAAEREPSPIGRDVLGQLLQNYEIASHDEVPICQDTGLMVLFMEIGQGLQIVDGDFNEHIQKAAARACKEGYLRASVVTDPLFDRKNTGDNSPVILHTRIVPGDRLTLTVIPKGFGSENMSRLAMLTPSQGVEGVKAFILDTVVRAGPNPCPPIILGVGIGGSFELAALMAKRMTARPVGSKHSDPRYADLEAECLAQINGLGIGPGGLGGRCTALAVNMDFAPTHIAGLPVAVNISCHASRHASITL